VTSDLRELYQQTILDHHRKPRNFRALPDATHTAKGYNPLCGDQIQLALRVEDEVIKDAAWEGTGCAISRASASMMTGAVIGKSRHDVDALFERVHAMLTTGANGAVSGASGAVSDANGDAAHELGKLAVFAGVREFPSRVKCATLAWHTLVAALSGAAKPVTTE
jgi:nitrogen fixation NifU-like protein